MQKYIESFGSMNFGVIQKAAVKEASRQVGEMSRWLTWMPEYDPDGYESLSYLVDPIKKAETYRYSIYNRTKELKPILKEIEKLQESQLMGEEIDLDRLIELRKKKLEKEIAQYTEAIRILNIYCIVLGLTSLVPPKHEAIPDDEDMYGDTE